MITTNSRIEGKKPSGLMLPPMGILGIVPCVKAEEHHISIFMYPEIKQLAIKRVDEYGFIQRISLTGFPAQSVGSSNTDVLDLPCLLILITGTSQSRQHGKSESDSYYLSDYAVNSFPGTSLIHIESLPSFLSLCELIGVQQVLEVELCLNEIYLMILWL
ncbi:hypothetical protein Tco_0735578 [Tanacetum coccineum]